MSRGNCAKQDVSSARPIAQLLIGDHGRNSGSEDRADTPSRRAVTGTTRPAGRTRPSSRPEAHRDSLRAARRAECHAGPALTGGGPGDEGVRRLRWLRT